MRRRGFLLVSSLALLLLSGCLSAGDAPPALPATDPVTPDETLAPEATPRTELVDAVVPITFATPLHTMDGTDGSFNGVDLAHLVPAANVTGYVVDVEWVPVDALHQELAIWVRGHTNPPAPQPAPEWILLPTPHTVVRGPSPLRVALDAATLTDPEGYTVFVRASDGPVGVTVSQPIQAFVTHFEEVAYDPSFSARTAGAGAQGA